MLFWLMDDIWTSLGAVDALNSALNKFRASWTNSYQRPRAADLERLDKVSSGDRGQLQARTMIVYL